MGTQNRQRKRPNPEISDTSVTKNDMGSVKCSFRRASAVEWFGQISRLGSSVASIWYMATDFGRRFVTWAHYTTWAQSRDFRGRKALLSVVNEARLCILFYLNLKFCQGPEAFYVHVSTAS